MRNLNVLYSSDADLEQSSVIVFKNIDGDIEAIHVKTYEDTEQTFIYSLGLFKKPSDSFISEDDLTKMNSSCDSKFKYNEEFKSRKDQANFLEDIIWYYGGENFDSSPLELHTSELEEWLEINVIRK